MLKLENTEVVGWEASIRGMRNPMNSWEKSDSTFCRNVDCGEPGPCSSCDSQFNGCLCQNIGPNDYKLMMSLAKAGPVHAKYRRMIVVYVDITAPLYWWKEFDTYKVGTVANSCSTMHKIHEKEFTLEDFSTEHLGVIGPDDIQLLGAHYEHYKHVFEIDYTISELNIARRLYIAADNKLKRDDLTDAERKHTVAQRKRFRWQMIQLLPSSYNQRRTVMMNYEVLAGIYPMRKNNMLDEWHEFCAWIESLPYSELITGPSLNDIPIAKEIMEEAERRVESRIAKQWDNLCAMLGVDLAKGTDFTGCKGDL